MEFPGWTDLESIKAYISRVRKCLLDDESKGVFDERLPQDASNCCSTILWAAFDQLSLLSMAPATKRRIMLDTMPLQITTMSLFAEDLSDGL
ncbi:hypothetical protein K457DRAFT_137877 [Linnemannia elongata AG-77]|uniref:Uncharacterized protein n=1 Tax=Linnemannia elongata AG-77 TaxID=1314771 RepID=A0A197JWP5_9FUNG|nr:hypothetical protein K457DRAFT_137877 [Linnemannia elongata AG-77]